MEFPREFTVDGFVPANVEASFKDRAKLNLSLLQGWKAMTFRNILDFAKFVLFKREAHKVTVNDARKLQAESGLTPAEFFNKYGFVLLKHKTAMQQSGWQDDKIVKSVYAQEVEALIRKELDLGEDFIVCLGGAVVRGPGFESYGLGIHQDYGLSPEDYLVNIDAYSGKEEPKDIESLRREHFLYDAKHPKAMLSLNFWRPIEPMTGPVEQHPLMLCDRNCVAFEDAVPTSLKGFAPFGRSAPSQHLRYSQKHRFYVYPRMAKDEVLVHVQFAWREGMKFSDEPGETKQSKVFPSCFHGALVDKQVSKTAEKRYSAEYRCRVDFRSDKMRYNLGL